MQPAQHARRLQEEQGGALAHPCIGLMAHPCIALMPPARLGHSSALCPYLQLGCAPPKLCDCLDLHHPRAPSSTGSGPALKQHPLAPPLIGPGTPAIPHMRKRPSTPGHFAQKLMPSPNPTFSSRSAASTLFRVSISDTRSASSPLQPQLMRGLEKRAAQEGPLQGAGGTTCVVHRRVHCREPEGQYAWCRAAACCVLG